MTRILALRATRRSTAARLLVVATAATAALIAFVPSAAHAHAPIPEDIEHVSRKIEANPGTARLYLERGELWRLNGHAEDAASDFRRAEALDPALDRLPLCRAALDLDRGASAAAIARLATFLEEHPGTPEALRLRARAHESLGDAPAVAADLRRLVRETTAATPGDVLALAEAERAGGDATAPLPALERALAALTDGMERLGPLAVLESAAADLEFRLGRTDAAATRLGRVARLLDDSHATAEVPPNTPTHRNLLTPAAAQATTPLPRLSTWKYHAEGQDLGTAWRAPAFADGGWPTGPGILGYGDPFIVTPIPFGPDPNNKYPTTYFRTTFNLTDAPASITSLMLNVNYDDGFAAYLNGQEIARRGLPAGAGYGDYAVNHEGGAWEPIDVGAFIGALLPGANVLAVEVHQTNASSSDLAFDAEIVYGTAAQNVTRGPYLQIGTPTGVTLRWRTDVPTDTRVRYGSAPGALTGTVDVAGATTEHEVTLTGLQPESRYYYSVGSSTATLEGDDALHTFRTSPPVGAPRPTRFWILGDSGLPGSVQNGVRDAWETYAAGAAADVWLMLGDNAYNAGTDAEFQAGLFAPYAAQLRKTVLWLTRGNHDVLYSGGGNDYYDLFSLPTMGQAGGVPSGTEAYYAFDHGNVHCVCLDSEGTDRSVNGAMLSWLRLDLAATTQAWTIAFWHHPPYTKGSHNSDDDLDSGGRMRDMRANVLPILDSLGVDLVLTGHSHSYERSLLLKEHYGTSGTLVPSMIVDGGDGNPANDGAYEKPTPGRAPREGAVYAVAGSSARTSGGALNYPAMVRSLNVAGSMVLDVNANRLDGRFLTQTGALLDTFTLLKGTGSAVGEPGPGAAGLVLSPPRPNPSSGAVRLDFSLVAATPVQLLILDVSGRRVRSIDAGVHEAGRHELTWDGRDSRGDRVAPGVYFIRLLTDGSERRTRVVVLK